MDSNASAAVDRLRGLLNWWGATGNAGATTVAPDLFRFANSVTAIQKAYLGAVEKHLDTVFATNDRIARAARGLAGSSDPNALLAAQNELMTAVVEAAADYAANWGDLYQSIQALTTPTLVAPTESAAQQPVKVERAAPVRAAAERAPREPAAQATDAAA